MVGEKLICNDCEHKGLAFDETHTTMHTLVRVSESVDETEMTVEDRLQLVEEELAKMREILTKLVEKSTEGSLSDPLTKGDLQAAVIETESAQSEAESDTGSAQSGEESVQSDAESAQSDAEPVQSDVESDPAEDA